MFEEENNPSSGNMIFAIVEIAWRVCIIITLTGEEHNANQMKSGSVHHVIKSIQG